MGASTPEARPAQPRLPEVWHLNEPIYEAVLGGEAVHVEDALYPITRHGAFEDAWFDLSFVHPRGGRDRLRRLGDRDREDAGDPHTARRLETLHRMTAEASGATSRVARSSGRSRRSTPTRNDVPFAAGLPLLAASWHVDGASDGAEALEVARRGGARSASSPTSWCPASAGASCCAASGRTRGSKPSR
jgi:hypothetical protein